MLCTRLLVIGCILAVLGTGCGATEEQPEPTTDRATVRRIGVPVYTSSLTPAKHRVHANRICRESWIDLLGYFADHREQRQGRDTEAQMFAYSTRKFFLPNAQFWFDDVSYLGAPKGEKVEIEDMLKVLQLSVHSARELRISTPRLLLAAFAGFNRLAAELGLEGCLVRVQRFRHVTSDLQAQRWRR